MTKNTKNLRLDIVCEEQDKRLSAFRGVKKLSNTEALPILKKGLIHWDRKLRNMCAMEIVRRLGGKAAPIILPLHVKGLLYVSCSYEALLKHEDPDLIQYLKKAGNKSTVSDVAKRLLLSTKYHAKEEAKRITQEAKKAEQIAVKKRKDILKKQNQQEKQRQKEVATKKAKLLKEIPVLKVIDPCFAEYVYRYWVSNRGMDNLYKVSEIPKRSGGTRQIEAPCASLKMVQKGILSHVFGEVRHHKACHGFITEHSIVTNASPHVGKDVVLNLDLKNFFPSISAGRTYGIYKSFVGENRYARFLTDVSVFKGRLPQGAPTSPMIANLACLRLDRRLAGLASKQGMEYTRYADDLTFSGSESIIRYIPAIKKIVNAEGFQIAIPKLRIHRKGSRQEVTGLTVNQRVSVPRVIRRRLRAAVHAISQGKTPTWKGEPLTSEALRGHINFVSSIHPDLGAKLLKQVSSKSKKKRKQ